MAKFIIKGGRPLKGAVRIGGAKNAGFKLMIASLLASGESRLLNVSKIGDVAITRRIIESLDGKVNSPGERTVFINPSGISKYKIPPRFGSISRTTSLFVGPLLARFGKAEFPLPGGDSLGARPIERFIAGFKALGARVKIEKEMVKVSCLHLRGFKYRFAKSTHTGTEAMIMVAVLARGETLIENAALEPEIDDLISFLNKSGAKIKRLSERKIKIEGVNNLKGSIYAVMPDRNEAVSYACAAFGTKGDIIIENARADDLAAFLEKVKMAGGKFEVADYGIRFWYERPLRAVGIVAKPHPGFMSDWQPLWTVLMTQAKGRSQIVETVNNFRFQFADSINKMGGEIQLFNPKIKDPESFYNFTLETDRPEDFHAAYVSGPTPLRSTEMRVPDIRSGATLTLAALIAKGKSILTNVEHIDRGYENLDGRLRELGANIKRVD